MAAPDQWYRQPAGTGQPYRTLRTLMSACLKQTGRLNSWRSQMTTYFFQECTYPVPAAAAYCGDIFACEADGTARHAGRFYIAPDGTLRGPGCLPSPWGGSGAPAGASVPHRGGDTE